MSTMKLIAMNDEEIMVTNPSTRGKSSRITASTKVLPTPGITKICSTTKAPPIKPPVLKPKTVTKEKSEGHRTWRNIIQRSESPLAFAIRTKSSCKVVIKSVLNRRKYVAAKGRASVIPGKTVDRKRLNKSSSS